jgi:hypothetical protein
VVKATEIARVLPLFFGLHDGDFSLRKVDVDTPCKGYHGGFRGEFSLSPGNGLFFALLVLFSFLKCVF